MNFPEYVLFSSARNATADKSSGTIKKQNSLIFFILILLPLPRRTDWRTLYKELRQNLGEIFRRFAVQKESQIKEGHLHKKWVAYYYNGRLHSSLGPGIPDSSAVVKHIGASRHQIPDNQRIISKLIPGGLHHEYSLEKLAA